MPIYDPIHPVSFAQMKRVLLTVHKFFPDHKAGTEVLTLKVAQELQQRGYQVKVLTADPPDVDARYATGPMVRDIEYGGIPVQVLGESLRLSGYTYDHEFYHPAMKQQAKALICEFKPDIMHVFHAQNLSAAIVESAQECNIPAVFSSTDFWFVCPVVQLKRPDGTVCRGPGEGGKNCLSCYTPHLIPSQEQLIEAVARRVPGTDKLLHACGPIGNLAKKVLHTGYSASKLPAARSSTLRRPEVLKGLANQFKRIMVPTRLMRDIFIENGIDESLITLVPFGIDTAPLEPFQEKAPSPALRVGFIGTLFEHKGPDLLLDAFNLLPAGADAELNIYGDTQQFPDYGAWLLNRANGRHRDKIHFHGTFPNDALGSVLQKLDVLVVPSRWYENTPLVIQSSLATKTPLIVTNLGGMAEIIQHERNGLLFDLNSVTSLHRQLMRLLEDRLLLKQLRDNIEPERTIPQMVDDIETVYREAAGLSEVLPASRH